MGRVSLCYTLYPKTKRRVDTMNVVSIVSKFTEDALVEMGVIEDDNSEVVCDYHIHFGEVDRENPRVELQIIEL